MLCLNIYTNYLYVKYNLFLIRHFDETDPSFTLEEIIKMKMQKYEDKINEVSNRATMELNIENVIVNLIIIKIVNIILFLFMHI